MVGEMRRHEDTAQRENVMQNITSETLQSLGLDEWIEQHGGFVSVIKQKSVCVCVCGGGGGGNPGEKSTPCFFVSCSEN